MGSITILLGKKLEIKQEEFQIISIVLNLKPNSQIAIISKNCAHWIITDLAIMMSGNTSVPLYANVKWKKQQNIYLNIVNLN